MKRGWLEKLETWVVVSVITVLVWLYAEGAIVERHPRETVSIEFVGPSGVPMQVEPDFAQTFVTFRSNGPVYQRFQSQTARPIRLEVEPSVGETAGQAQTIDLRGRLESALFNPLGVAIDEIEPAAVQVTAQRLVQRPIPVVVDDGGLDLRGPATVEPTSVTVTVTESVAARIDALLARDPASVAATADLRRKVGDNPPPPGQADVVTVTLEPPVIDGQAIGTMRTRDADVSYTLANREGKLELASIPLRQVTPLGFPFEVRSADDARVLDDVTLTGPSDTLARIESGELPVWAELHFFDATQLTAGPMSVEVQYRLPPGVSAARSLRQINVELRDRRTAVTGE